VWTTQLLKEIKSLSFGGDNLMVSYASWFCGISVFSLALVSESSMVSGISLRQRMLHFKNTESNHLTAEASEMANLSATGDAIPGIRAEMQAWMDHVGITTKMLMGDACPMFGFSPFMFAETALVCQMVRGRMESPRVGKPHGLPSLHV
jgi:hypothetical protein